METEDDAEDLFHEVKSLDAEIQSLNLEPEHPRDTDTIYIEAPKLNHNDGHERPIHEPHGYIVSTNHHPNEREQEDNMFFWTGSVWDSNAEEGADKEESKQRRPNGRQNSQTHSQQRPQQQTSAFTLFDDENSTFSPVTSGQHHWPVSEEEKTDWTMLTSVEDEEREKNEEEKGAKDEETAPDVGHKVNLNMEESELKRMESDRPPFATQPGALPAPSSGYFNTFLPTFMPPNRRVPLRSQSQTSSQGQPVDSSGLLSYQPNFIGESGIAERSATASSKTALSALFAAIENSMMSGLSQRSEQGIDVRDEEREALIEALDISRELPSLPDVALVGNSIYYSRANRVLGEYINMFKKQMNSLGEGLIAGEGNVLENRLWDKMNDVESSIFELLRSSQDRERAAPMRIPIDSNDMSTSLDGDEATADVDNTEDDTINILGTQLRDLNSALVEAREIGTNVTDSPLNSPWILLIFPMAPLGIMYAWTLLNYVYPILAVIFSILGLKWLSIILLLMLFGTLWNWNRLKTVRMLRAYFLEVEFKLLILRNAASEVLLNLLTPQVFAVLYRLACRCSAYGERLDLWSRSVLGVSPRIWLKARIFKWEQFEDTDEILFKEPSRASKPTTATKRKGSKEFGNSSKLTKLSMFQRVVSKINNIRYKSLWQRTAELNISNIDTESEPNFRSESEILNSSIDSHFGFLQSELDLFKAFRVKIDLKSLRLARTDAQLVWVELEENGVAVARSPLIDLHCNNDGKGNARREILFDSTSFTQYVFLPFYHRRSDASLASSSMSSLPSQDTDKQADRTSSPTNVSVAVRDRPIKLVVKGCKMIPIYSNDGMPRYPILDSQMSSSERLWRRVAQNLKHWGHEILESFTVGYCVLSARRLGIGARTDRDQAVADVEAPLIVGDAIHDPMLEKFCSGVLKFRVNSNLDSDSSLSYVGRLVKLPGGDWSIAVHVFELRGMEVTSDSAVSNPFVEVIALGQKRTTQTVVKATSCLIEETLSVSGLRSGSEMSREIIKISVYSSRLGVRENLGEVMLQASTVYEMTNHCVYRKWCRISGHNSYAATGHIKISVAVLPPGVPLPADFSKDFRDLNPLLLRDAIIYPPMSQVTSWIGHVSIGFLDMLPCMEKNRSQSMYFANDMVRVYAIFKFSSAEPIQTRTIFSHAYEISDPRLSNGVRIRPQREVVFNNEFVFPFPFSNQSDSRTQFRGIEIEFYHRPSIDGARDRKIASLFLDLWKLMRNQRLAIVRGSAQDGESLGDRVREVSMKQPAYYHFYGNPDGSHLANETEHAYRGRLLLGFGAKPGSIPEAFMRPCRPLARPALRYYCLTLNLCRATEMPVPDNYEIRIHGECGPFVFGETFAIQKIRRGCIQWNDNPTLVMDCLQFPENAEEIPDLFLTLWALPPVKYVRRTRHEFFQEKQLAGNFTSKELSDIYTRFGVIEDGNTGYLLEPETEQIREWKRFAFLRLSVGYMMAAPVVPRWMYMDFPGSPFFNAENVPGSLLFSCQLALSGSGLSPYDQLDLNRADQPDKLRPESEQSKRRSERLEDTIKQKIRGRPSSTRAKKELEEKREQALRDVLAIKKPAALPLAPIHHKNQLVSYELRALISRGVNLAASDPSGLSDPFVVLSIGDQARKGRVICRQTVNPIWDEMICVPDIILAENEIAPNVNVIVYDWSPQNRVEYLGRCIIPIQDLDIYPPSFGSAKWYNLFTFNPEVAAGRILADFQFVATDSPHIASSRVERSLIKPTMIWKTIRISFLGLQHVKTLRPAHGSLFIELTSADPAAAFIMRTRPGALLNRSETIADCNILDVLILRVQIPQRVEMADYLPAFNAFVYAKYDFEREVQIVATTSIRLRDLYMSSDLARLSKAEGLIKFRSAKFWTDSMIPGLQRMSQLGLFLSQDALAELKKRQKVGWRLKRLASASSVDTNLAGHLHRAQTLSLPQDGADYQHGHELISMNAEREFETHAYYRRTVELHESSPGLSPVSTLVSKVHVLLHFLFLDLVRELVRLARSWVSSTMPDVASRLGIRDANDPRIEPQLDLEYSSMIEPEDENGIIDRGDDAEHASENATILIRTQRGYIAGELETIAQLHQGLFANFSLARGKSRIGDGELTRLDHAHVRDYIEDHRELGEYELVRSELKRAVLEGKRPTVGNLKASIDIIEDIDVHDFDALRNYRSKSLRAFGTFLQPATLIVRVYVLSCRSLQKTDSMCNAFLNVKFLGGCPSEYTTRKTPILDSTDPLFFLMFDSQVAVPGGGLSIEVKHKVMPKLSVPVKYPWYVRDEILRKTYFGVVKDEISVNFGSIGFAWEEHLGSTFIDLDTRWFSPCWRSLERTPVESRHLWAEDSPNGKGTIDLFVDIIDAEEYQRRPHLYPSIPLQLPVRKRFMFRCTIFDIQDVYLPFLLSNDINKFANFYAAVRFGNDPDDERKTDLCKYSYDGTAAFNWRMGWWIKLPNLDSKPRLKIQVFEDLGFGASSDRLCALVDVKIRSLLTEALETGDSVIRRKQAVVLRHPYYPSIRARASIALEVVPEEHTRLKSCNYGQDGYDTNQHPDYVLPKPFRPAVFSVVNPSPYFSYTFAKMMEGITWQVMTYSLLIPLIIMGLQFVWFTPWYWYLVSGIFGLIIYLRVSYVGWSDNSMSSQNLTPYHLQSAGAALSTATASSPQQTPGATSTSNSSNPNGSISDVEVPKTKPS